MKPERINGNCYIEVTKKGGDDETEREKDRNFMWVEEVKQTEDNRERACDLCLRL